MIRDGLDEVHRVVVVLFEPGGNRQDVRVEDDVDRIEAGLSVSSW